MPGTVVGVASERDVIVLEGRVPAAALLAVLDERSVAGKQLHVFGDRTTLVVSRENLHDEARLRAALKAQFAAHVDLVDGLGAVSVIGTGINHSYANVRAGSDAMAAAGIAAAGASTSSFRITWMVRRERLDDAVRALHACFIEVAAPAVPPDA